MSEENILKKALAILNRQAAICPEPKKGITVADVLEVFEGARIVPAGEPKSCPHCGDNPHAKIVPCKWPDGKQTLICHACGREWNKEKFLTRIKIGARLRVHPLKALEGKRGGVFCRGCYRPMSVSIVNGGYDWSCEPCAMVWRYRP